MRVLVTGATGFLGGALTRSLIARGDSVVALGRNPAKLAALAEPGVTTIEADLARGQAAIPGAIGELDAVVHCAALSTQWAPRAAFEAANVTGTETALAVARRSGARRFVNISSPTVYFALRDSEGVSETASLPPAINDYAATKAEAERRVLAERDLSPISLRPRGIYGKGDSALLPRLIAAAERGPLPLLRGGAASIDLTHVSDVVSAIEAALVAGPDLSGEVFNISGGEALPVRQIVEAAAARAGINVTWRRLPLTPVLAAARAIELANRVIPLRREPRLTRYAVGLFAYRQSLDITKAERVLGWSPKVRLQEGLDLTFGSDAR